MPRRTDKAELKRELLASLEAQLATARAAHAAATEGAINEEARPENDKDTRGLEQSYLARGHAQRVAELEAAVAAVEAMTVGRSARVSLGALVTVDENQRQRLLYIAPYGGGLALGSGVTVVTPTAPIGRALLGKVVDDEVELDTGSGARALAIVEIT